MWMIMALAVMLLLWSSVPVATPTSFLLLGSSSPVNCFHHALLWIMRNRLTRVAAIMSCARAFTYSKLVVKFMGVLFQSMLPDAIIVGFHLLLDTRITAGLYLLSVQRGIICMIIKRIPKSTEVTLCFGSLLVLMMMMILVMVLPVVVLFPRTDTGVRCAAYTPMRTEGHNGLPFAIGNMDWPVIVCNGRDDSAIIPLWSLSQCLIHDCFR